MLEWGGKKTFTFDGSLSLSFSLSLCRRFPGFRSIDQLSPSLG